MKKKIHKILGVALTATLLASLMVGLAAAPAMAGANDWDEFDVPATGSTDDYFMDNDFGNLGPMEIAIDGTLFVAAEYETENHIFKSDDGGRTWSQTDYYDDVGDTNDDTIVDIACSSMDADILWVTDGTYVYWSEDADNFEALGSPPTATAGKISCMDVGYIDDDPHIFIGTIGIDGAPDGDDVWMAMQVGFTLDWVDQDIMTDRSGTAYTAVNVFDVRAGLDFDGEKMVMAVVGCTVTTDQTRLTSRKGGAQWAATKGDIELRNEDAATHLPVTFPLAAGDDATIWMPDDFDSDDREVLVGIDDSGGDGGDVYWLIGSSASFDLDIAGTETSVDVTDLHGAGNIGDASLIAATDSCDMRYSDDYGDSWTKNKKRPTGEDVSYVRVAADFLDSEEAWAVTNGADAACSITRDSGTLWNGISLMDTEMVSITDIEPTPDFGSSGALFMVTQTSSVTDPYADSWYQGNDLWMYDGDYWERIFHSSLLEGIDDYISDVEVSPEWVSDECVVFGDKTSGNNRAYRSTDGGGRFIRQNSAAAASTVTIWNWLVVDDRTYLVTGHDSGGTGVIRRTTNNGTTWTTEESVTGAFAVAGFVSIALDPNNPDNMLAGCRDGKVHFSEDGGNNWDSKGTPEDAGDILFPAFDPEFATNDTLYAAVSGTFGRTKAVYRRTDTTWSSIAGITSTWPKDEGADESINALPENGFVVGPDGIMYVIDWTDNESAVARSINPADGSTSGNNGVYFETMNDGWGDDGKAWGLWMVPGSNMLYTINIQQAEVWEYTDEIVAPKLSTPSDGASSERIEEVTLQWNEVEGADEYIVYWDTDPGFSYPEVEFSTTTAKRLTGLEDGQEYYWKVAVWASEPCLSPWSSEWSFTTALSAAEWNPFVGGVPESPANGATNVPLTPTFAWNPADWATGYEFILAKDAAFTDVVVSKTGANALSGTAYLSEQTLANSTTYYWQVRAISKATESEWATGVFTTEGKAPAPPAPPAPPPPAPPAPGTPMYIWVIIGVGAALVIAVIILIVRTRRVA